MNAINLKAFAEEALDKGFRIFPLKPQTKLPATEHGFKNATFQPSQIDEWWDAETGNPQFNIGIACGESNLCVLDFDNGEDLPDWVKTIKTLKVKTSRGIHVYFYGARESSKMFIGGKHVGEIKSRGGYILGNGSVHPDGPIYTVIDDSLIAEAPDRISELLNRDGHNSRSESWMAESIPDGQRNNTLHAISGALREFGLPVHAIHAAVSEINNHQCESPIDPHELKKLVESAGKYPVGQTTVRCSGVPLDGPDAIKARLDAEERAAVADFRNLLQGNFRDGTASWILQNVQKASDLSSKPIEWIVEEMIFKTGLHLFSGKQGSMKSMLALMLAKTVACSEPFMGRKNIGERITVVYVDKENPQSEVRRRCAALGLLNLDNFRIWGDWQIDCPPPLTFDDPRLLECARRDNTFFVFDSLSSFLDGAGENDTGEMMAIMGKARLLARTCSGVAILHHQAKNGPAGSRGNTAIPASTDMAFIVEKEGQKVTVSEERFRMCAGYQMSFEMDFGGTTGLYTPKVIDNGLSGTRAVRPISKLTDEEKERLAVGTAEFDQIQRAKTEIEKAYADGKRLNQAQLALLVGVTSNRIKTKLLTGSPDRPWRCVTGGGRGAVYFIPKNVPGLPGENGEEAA